MKKNVEISPPSLPSLPTSLTVTSVPFRHVVLIGVGLLGGSVALAVRRRFPDVSLSALRYRAQTGFQRCSLASLYPNDFAAVDSTDTATHRNVDIPTSPIHSSHDRSSSESSSHNSEKTLTNPTIKIPTESTLVIVCTPVQTIAEIVRKIANYGNTQTLITDVGSTKREIITSIESEGTLANGVRFVGSHPIAGSERSGPDAADATLFESKMVAITPTERSAAQDVQRLQMFWQSIGAQTITLSPSEHDRILARTSHLPHLVAATLSLCVSEKDFPLTGTGFRDTTRIAAGLPSLWTPIFMANREPLLDALTSFQIKLTLFRAALESATPEQIEQFLTQAERNRNAV